MMNMPPLPKCPNCRMLYRLLRQARAQVLDRTLGEEIDCALELVRTDPFDPIIE